jgi:hypothetical protein
MTIAGRDRRQCVFFGALGEVFAASLHVANIRAELADEPGHRR